MYKNSPLYKKMSWYTQVNNSYPMYYNLGQRSHYTTSTSCCHTINRHLWCQCIHKSTSKKLIPLSINKKDLVLCKNEKFTTNSLNANSLWKCYHQAVMNLIHIISMLLFHCITCKQQRMCWQNVMKDFVSWDAWYNWWNNLSSQHAFYSVFAHLSFNILQD